MIKKTLKKFWKFIWNDNSILSWVVSFILAFLLVKFAIYPLIGLMFGTSYPIVAVVSCSMEHNAQSDCSFDHLDFDEWWNVRSGWYIDSGFTKEQFKDYIFKNGFDKGDIIILRGNKAKDIKVGDVIVFQSTSNYPVIHRVVNKWDDNGYHFQTKGDNNPDSYGALMERDITGERILGRAIFKVPKIGWVKIGFSEVFGG